MRKLCPNLDREDGLDTVLEVPVPEEMFMPASRNSRSNTNDMSGCNMVSWVRSQHNRSRPSADLDRAANLQLMLSVIGAPLLPISNQTRHSFVTRDINDHPIEASMAKYIVRQYIAAVGGEKVLDSITSMYAMGKVRMMAGKSNGMSGNKKAMKRCGEMGGFVLWQKQTDLWCLELLVSGCKLSAGSDGKVTWRQTSGRQSHASRGLPRPLRRLLQEASMAKYIVRQYIAAVGGEKALDSITSMYAMGKVRMMAGESNGMSGNKKAMKRCGEMGGFVLWQKQTDLWCLELLVSGYKLSAGSDGKVTWRQTSGRQSHASRGPPRPLRRLLQGLDPRSTANLFSNAICTGEKSANGEACFVLKLDAELAALRARSTKSLEIIRHTVLGYFSQRTGLLVQLEDSHLIRIEGTHKDRAYYWETTMETSVEDYRSVEGINISHKGRTAVSLVRFGESTIEGNMRTQMEEAWSVEEVDFNIRGLSVECFLPPGDLTEEKEDTIVDNGHPITIRLHDGSTRVCSSRVAALNSEEEEWKI